MRGSGACGLAHVHLRWPDRVVRGEGPSAKEAMGAAMRAAGLLE